MARRPTRIESRTAAPTSRCGGRLTAATLPRAADERPIRWADMADDSQKMTKIVFRVVEEDGSVNVETPWVTPVGEDLYRLENSPFYAYSVSWLDIVRAPFCEFEGRPAFEAVVEKSGHRTIRIVFDPPVAPQNDSEKVLLALVEMGCSYEGANPSYICVNIPPESDFDAIRDYLIAENADFEHSDPTYDELFP